MIGAQIADLLRPLEDFEAVRRKAVRFGDRLCDLSYANPYQGAHERAIAVIEEALRDRRLLSLQYSPFGGQTIARRLVADALRESHGLPFAYGDVILTPGAMSALHLALLTAVDQGGEVIIPTPCWLDYHLYVLHAGGLPVSVPLAPKELGLDVDAITSAITTRTNVILLSTPCNPTGRTYDSATLARLARAVSQREAALGTTITIIADETHRDFTAPGAFDSLARHFDRTVIVYSFGKYHFMQGQRLGYAAVSPRDPERHDRALEMVRWTRITGIATPTALMQRALPGLLQLRHDLGWLTVWRSKVTTRLRQAGYRLVLPDATLFVYVRIPPGTSEQEFISRLAGQGVLVLPAGVFHHSGYFRLALTGHGSLLERALQILENVSERCPA